MVESIIQNAIDILNTNIQKEFYIFKELLSKLFMIDFLNLDEDTKFIEYVTNLGILISDLKDIFLLKKSDVSDEEIGAKIKGSEDLFYKIMLTPLDLQDENVLSFIEQIKNKGIYLWTCQTKMY